MNPSFWRNKRVLLTGHTGFKGGWLSLWLSSVGAKVTGYSLPAPTQPSLFELAGIAGQLEHHEGDVRDLATLQKTFKQAQPEIAIHMAAQSLVRLSYAEPVETYSTNVMGTVNFLEAARHQPSLRASVVVTSDKCYQSRDQSEGYLESDPMGGADPYSSSKGCAELVTTAYRDSFFGSSDASAVASVRAGNVIGGGDWAKDRLVPDILRALASGKSPEIRNPAAVRPWQHVLEPLSGYLLVAEKLWEDKARFAESWNFGPDQEDERPVKWIVERLCEYWGHKEGWQGQPGEHPKEAKTLRLNSSKAARELGWKPGWNLDHSLKAIVEWHRQYSSGADIQKLTLSQIAEYQKGNHDAKG